MIIDGVKFFATMLQCCQKLQLSNIQWTYSIPTSQDILANDIVLLLLQYNQPDIATNIMKFFILALFPSSEV